MLRYLTAGESHGPALVVTMEGLPAGIPLLVEHLSSELARRRLGYGRGPRMRFEADEVEFIGGVRHGRTIGSPVAVLIHNSEWKTGKWESEMSAAPGVTEKPLTKPRPGHADLVGMQKYGFVDARDVLERASARETAARVVAGAIAKQLLANLDIAVLSHVVQLGSVKVDRDTLRPSARDLNTIDESEVRCFDPIAQVAMVEEIKAAAKAGDSLGGVVEVLAYGTPAGLGSHVHWDRRLDGMIAQALMSIQAMKGVEIGDGFDVAGVRGSVAHDAIHWDDTAGYVRETARAGGIEGGMSTGEVIVARAAMKPLATLNRPVLTTVDVVTKQETVSFKERTDVTAVPAAGVVGETMMALVLAQETLRKFGGDSLAELARNCASYRKAIQAT